MKFGIGQSVPRREDPRLVTGAGQFTDDLNFPEQLHLRMCRSPYAHGVIESLDVSEALSMPGVVAVYTAADIAELGAMPCRAVVKDRAGNAAYIPRRPLLAEDRVLFVGQAVAAVVAETAEAAQLAVEQIDLQVRTLPTNVDPGAALDIDTIVLHVDNGSNQCVHYEVGDAEATQTALNSAAHIVELELINNRVAPTPLEPRASLGLYDPDGGPEGQGQYVLYNPSQGAFAHQSVLANAIFKVPMEQVRVVSLDTGGGFGIRGEVHPEACLVLFAAKAIGQPVKYSGDRSEMFLADSHGRDNITKVRAGFDNEGLLQGLQVETIANIGAYCNFVGPFVPTVAGGRVVGTVYRAPHVHHSVRPVFTNTMPVAAYRGAGRPEACYVMERLMERAADVLGMSSIDLRKLNFIAPDEMPYTLASGVELTCGEFARTLDMSLAAADWDGFGTRQTASQAGGLLRGRGVGYYVESSGGGPEEEARVSLRDDGGVDVVVGTYSHGQGHRTMFSQILSEQLGIDFDQIHILQGDTREVAFGGGTGGSRSSQMGGIAVRQACALVLDDAKDVAAELLQVPVASVAYADGVFTNSKNASEVGLAQVAQAAQDEQFGGGRLERVHRYNRGAGYSFPNGCHVAEVEVDPETGVVSVDRYTAVDDCGRVINPLLAAGQVHGGVVQGIGQCLYEAVVYAADGQLLTGSFTDYVMPRAAQVPAVDVSFHEVLDPNNELGVKGIGEGGACGAPPAVVNAVIDALKPLGINHLDMPLAPHRVWQAIGTAADSAP